MTALPDSDGWWIFHEDGINEPQRLLIRSGVVASDEEWAEETGYAVSETLAENYWEGNEVAHLTDGTLTTGTWSKEANGDKETEGLESLRPASKETDQRR